MMKLLTISALLLGASNAIVCVDERTKAAKKQKAVIE